MKRGQMTVADILQDLAVILGSAPLDDHAAKAAGIKLYDATFNGRRVKVTIPED